MRHLSRADGENQSDQVPLKRHGFTFLKDNLAGVVGKAFAMEVPLQGMKWRSTRSSQQWWTRMSVVVFTTSWENQSLAMPGTSGLAVSSYSPLSQSCKKQQKENAHKRQTGRGRCQVRRRPFRGFVSQHIFRARVLCIMKEGEEKAEKILVSSWW